MVIAFWCYNYTDNTSSYSITNIDKDIHNVAIKSGQELGAQSVEALRENVKTSIATKNFSQEYENIRQDYENLVKLKKNSN
ncbi:MAG: hypothetical protein F6K24_32660 [Okeania sp. SIO2D1]|nr:hypothetical protein [Okeania sp. SIO2D1]